jgi:hypothetical protein
MVNGDGSDKPKCPSYVTLSGMGKSVTCVNGSGHTGPLHVAYLIGYCHENGEERQVTVTVEWYDE